MNNLDLAAIHTFAQKSFTELMIHENDLNPLGFKEWIFYPGMLFQSQDKWWGDRERRSRPHEGLDLCLYRDHQGRVLRLDEATRIPALDTGMIVGIFDDFFETTIMVEHSFNKEDSGRLYSLYGHVHPAKDLHIGDTVKSGDGMAVLAELQKPENGLFPHLHLSLAWTNKPFSDRWLDWETITRSADLKLLDPLRVLGGHYGILEEEKCGSEKTGVCFSDS